MDRIYFHNWTIIRQALEEVYKELGLEMTKLDNGSEYPVEHWNIAGLMYVKLQKKHEETLGSCYSCRKALDYYTVIRCLDCRSTLCEYCAKIHFGPGHDGRAKAAHAG